MSFLKVFFALWIDLNSDVEEARGEKKFLRAIIPLSQARFLSDNALVMVDSLRAKSFATS